MGGLHDADSERKTCRRDGRSISYSPGATRPPQIQFDPDRSWVKPEVADAWNRYLWTPAHELLRHEQLHYAIDCLLTRQANVALSTGGDPVALRINVQYNVETNHGGDPWSQRVWQHAVESQLRAGSISPAPFPNSDK
ncbi:MAG: hypothetical protein E6K65_17410 [Nitrospirae bacterium]|nr:MAG: hypothetical protein E6K65_17410 [Nitrospirota bacterium]